MKTLYRRLTALGLGFLLAAVLLEIVFRITGIGAWENTVISTDGKVPPFHNAGISGLHAQVPTPGAEFRMFGHPVAINSAGFRGKPPAPEDAARRRVVAIGDSWTFGWAVGEEQTWPAQVETALNGRGTPARVYNLGVPSMDTEEEALWLKLKGPPLKPDAVVLGFCLDDVATHDNAFLQEYMKLRTAAGVDQQHRVPWSARGIWHARAARLERDLCEWSYLWRWGSDRFDRYYIARYIKAADTPLMAPDAYPNFIRDCYRPGGSARTRWEAALRDIVSTCREWHCPLVIISFPMLDRDMAHYRYADLHRPLHEALDGVPDVRIVEALDYLEKRTYTEAELMVPEDGHPGPLLYAKVGKPCAEALKDLLREPASASPTGKPRP